MRRSLAVAFVLIALVTQSLVALGQVSVPWSIAEELPGSESLTVSAFATELPFVMGMAVLPDGSLLVGASETGAGNFFTAPGQLLRFTDDDADGVADDPAGVPVATGLAGGIVNVRQIDDLVFVTSTNGGGEGITVLAKSADWSEPLTYLGSIAFQFAGAMHTSYGLAVRSGLEGERAIELFFNLGANGNEVGGGVVALSGLIESTLSDSAIYRTLVEWDGTALTLTEPELIATGLRNAAAFDFHPRSGDLIVTENGIDGFDDVTEPFSADEINVIPAADIGGAAEDFGFPVAYTVYRTGEVIGENNPLVAFQPMDEMESEGAASFAFAPATFPEGLDNGYFVGFHGQFNKTGDSNEENSVLFVDADSLAITPLIRSDAEGIGHIDTLVSTDDALWLADLCSAGGLNQGQPCGVIYKVAMAKGGAT